MKKILMGFVAACALTSFAVPAFADDAPAGDKKEEKAKGGKKGGKKEKKEEAKPAEGAAK